jgi:hypothetical protein
MFCSPCSLRSTQCAALIALAAAAGISRMEQPARTTSPHEPERLAARAVRANATAEPRFFELAPTSISSWANEVAAFAAWFFSTAQGGPRTDANPNTTQEHGRDVCPADLRPKLAGIGKPSASDLTYFERPTLALSIGRRFLPYAVGPPRIDVTLAPNAVGTCVPDDSAANGTLVWSASRVVCFAENASDARLARRPICPSAETAGLFAKDLFGLRAEPVSRRSHALSASSPSQPGTPRPTAVTSPSAAFL